MKSFNVGKRNIPQLKKQTGVALIVALIMVLLMTIVALTSIRGSGLQEAMAGNMRDRNIAFQSCETALREGEVLMTGVFSTSFDGTNGLFQDLSKNSPATSISYWASDDWKKKGKLGATTVEGAGSAPYFAAELIKVDPCDIARLYGGSCDLASLPTTELPQPYRISCFALGSTTDASVLLESATNEVALDK